MRFLVIPEFLEQLHIYKKAIVVPAPVYQPQGEPSHTRWEPVQLYYRPCPKVIIFFAIFTLVGLFVIVIRES